MSANGIVVNAANPIKLHALKMTSRLFIDIRIGN